MSTLISGYMGGGSLAATSILWETFNVDQSGGTEDAPRVGNAFMDRIKTKKSANFSGKVKCGSATGESITQGIGDTVAVVAHNYKQKFTCSNMIVTNIVWAIDSNGGIDIDFEAVSDGAFTIEAYVPPE